MTVMMKGLMILLLLHLQERVGSMQINNLRRSESESFRSLQRRALLVGVAGLANIGTSAFATDNASGNIEVYFGCGCFWHVQHEFVTAESNLLGRSNTALTARAGYAGGNAGNLDGKVCYHNAARIADYGSLGHAEVVGLKIPEGNFKDFAMEYFRLFDQQGNRPDQRGDRGPEYRNLVGIPGGISSPLAKQLVQASVDSGDRLDIYAGRGDDSDARAAVWVMDTQKHPFYVAEPYHQFHDGFAQGEDYPSSYNGLSKKLLQANMYMDSGCPAGALGIGIAGL